MKKRLSLLMVLMMIVSLLPMSAFAAATPGYTTLIKDVDDKDTVAVSYVLPVGVALNAGELRFELEGASFEDQATFNAVPGGAVATVKAGTATYVADADTKRVSSGIVTTQVPAVLAATSVGDVQVQVKFPVEFTKEGDVTLTVYDTNNLGVGTQTVKVAVVGTKDTSNLAISVKDAEKSMSFDGGKLSQFEIKNIDPTATQLTIAADKGIKFKAGTTVVGTNLPANVTATGAVNPSNAEELIVTFAGTGLPLGANTTVIVIPEFEKVSNRVNEGNVSVDVEVTTPALKGSSRAVIGKLVDYAVTMTVVQQGKKEIPNVWGGEEATVKVTLKGPKGSISNRPIDFKVDGADVNYGLSNGADLTSSIVYKALKPSDSTIDGDPDENPSTPVDTVFKNSEFSVEPSATASNAFDLLDEISFEIVIKTDGDKDGVATITASQRGWETTADLAKITPKFVAKADVTPIKKGEAKDAATITITEAKAGLLAKGERLNLTFDTRRDYTQITSKSIKIEATNGMTFDTSSSAIKWLDGKDGKRVGISVPITRSSAGEAAVITVTGINVAVDGSATDDVVALKAGLTDRDDKAITVSSPDYIKVVKEYDMESILSVFTIGQTAYTVNGETKAAHSAPYIKEGRTMLPIRAVAESLGLEVQWNSATRTASFTDASKVAAVTIGSKVLYVNGTPMPLTVPAELVNDTTFVELRSLATAFGVQIDWDAAAKTATVSK